MLAIILSAAAVVSTLTWEKLDSGVTTSIRGLDAVDSETCWLGTKGGVARTVDAGRTWKFMTVAEGTEELDFRDIEAFDANRCLAMSAGAGSASRVYLTENGGESWALVFENAEADGFFNGMAFRDDGHGILAGDPIDGRLYLLATNDHGKSWRRLAKDSSPKMGEDEHSFAASGTHLAVTGDQIWVSSGGGVARVLQSSDWGGSWSATKTPMISGLPSTGIFSVAVSPDESRSLIAVGGDYSKEPEGKDDAMRSDDAGKSWELVESKAGGAPFHFRSCVGYIDGKTLVAVGPSGSDISRDAGATWRPLAGRRGFHTLSIAGRVVWAAGADGRVGRLVFPDSGE